jgi:hypothetical protein
MGTINVSRVDMVSSNCPSSINVNSSSNSSTNNPR